MTHLHCTPCRLRFDRRLLPDLDACPTCDGPLEPLQPIDALGLSLFRGERQTAADAPAVGTPAWTDALSAAIQQLPPAR